MAICARYPLLTTHYLLTTYSLLTTYYLLTFYHSGTNFSLFERLVLCLLNCFNWTLDLVLSKWSYLILLRLMSNHTPTSKVMTESKLSNYNYFWCCVEVATDPHFSAKRRRGKGMDKSKSEGWGSADRNNKATLLLTPPCFIVSRLQRIHFRWGSDFSVVPWHCAPWYYGIGPKPIVARFASPEHSRVAI